MPFDPVQTSSAISEGKAVFHFFKSLNAEWWLGVQEGLIDGEALRDVQLETVRDGTAITRSQAGP